MEIKKIASAGSLDSSDVLVTVELNHKTENCITINSPFIRQFGQEMKNIVIKILNDLKINNCNIVIQDQGAINEVLIARIVTAISRATEQTINY
ncbi:citrate lyase acyl carrier protein [Spiroplasma attinicola]|uniref:citrate lyase acyl carrier protein n=1 Tax=Spiroplasma attinicola TaxID=2904537 RepID=UPI002022ABB7|nr:citrate lyase acyl carrier protein [Spiroplasma sp. JKS002670]MCL8210079.1 Citrate lyase acyl carrier protein [Spiroplasma sp. JKS002670]